VHNRAKSPLLRPSDVFSDIKELEGYFKFTFVRNPYTRVLSAYLDKIKGNKVEKREIVEVLGMDVNDYENIDIPFKRFLDTLASMENKSMNTHFKPQAMQSCYPMMNYNYIGKFEKFEADLIVVLGKVGCSNRFKFLEKVWPSMIKTSRHHQTNASNLYDRYYDLETENLVKEIYKQDFLEFGY
jgi:DNA-binding ferritin-like protein (Dps family)